MFTTNPFAILAETIPMMAIQSFVIIMVGLVILGTVLDMIHKKNVKYFFNNFIVSNEWNIFRHSIFLLNRLRAGSVKVEQIIIGNPSRIL